MWKTNDYIVQWGKGQRTIANSAMRGHMTPGVTKVIDTTNTKGQPLSLPQASAYKSTKSDVNTGMIFKPYPPRLALSEDPMPELLYSRVRLAGAKRRRLNAEVAQVFEGRKCLVAEERGHLFEKWKESWATIACKAHAECVRYACIDVPYSDEFHARVMRQKDVRRDPIW